MIFAASDALSIGQLVIAAGSVCTLAAAVGGLFVMRREHVAMKEEHERRIAALEALDATSSEVFLDHARRNADAHQAIEQRISEVSTAVRAELSHEVAGLREKIADVDRKVTATEVETRLQTKTLEAIARKLQA